MKRYVLTRLAESDLQGIKDFIAKDSTTAARRIVQELRAIFADVGESPDVGHHHEFLDPSVKVRNLYRYLVVYKPETRPVQILRVVGGNMDLPHVPLV